ncbi:MAG: hypothetical protein CVV21_05950 [Candidatus Goldiibacteriota bacterium HGW-Goldbacteria-1]|jgi:tetratricopeptide (TPR) repeat protein|nr:MAG: hypothetical protein CVV21_05950 [Candidatus Goldiibacteriota bacterium HGW-Goldbacteria-1]
MKRNYVIAFFFAAIAVFYVLCVPPSYNSDDSPETAAAYYTLGIQHPPGYPLSTLTGKIFTLLPYGNTAFKANLMAVFFNLLAGFLIFLSLRKIFGKYAADKTDEIQADFAALASSALYLFGETAWLQGIIAKGGIYSMNAFFMALCFWLLINMDRGKKYFYAFAFVYGISMGNHWTSMAAIAPAILLFLFFERKKLNIKLLLTAAALFSVGASVYIFVFIRSAAPPAYAWGDTKTLKDLYWLLSRAQYAGLEQKHTITDTLNLLKYYIANYSFKELPFLMGWIFLPGMFLYFKRYKKETGFLFFAWFFLLISVISVATPPAKTEWLIKTYLVSANMFSAMLGGFFIFWIFKKIKDTRATVLLFAVILLVPAVINRPDYGRYFVGYDYSKNLEKTLNPGAVLFCEGDMNIGAAIYSTLVDKSNYVPVIPVVFQYKWYRNQLKQNYPGRVNVPEPSGDMAADIMAAANLNSARGVYYTNVFTQQWVSGLRPQPHGVTEKILFEERNKVISDNVIKLYSFRGITDKPLKVDEFTKRLVYQNYANAYFALADGLRQAGYNPAAAMFYENGLFFYAADGAYINLGLAYYQIGKMEQAEKAWRGAIRFNPYSSVAYSNIAFIYIAKNDKLKAREYAQKALSLDPKNATAASVLQNLK